MQMMWMIVITYSGMYIVWWTHGYSQRFRKWKWDVHFMLWDTKGDGWEELPFFNFFIEIRMMAPWEKICHKHTTDLHSILLTVKFWFVHYNFLISMLPRSPMKCRMGKRKIVRTSEEAINHNIVLKKTGNYLTVILIPFSYAFH